jgi:hypothetical protein
MRAAGPGAAAWDAAVYAEVSRARTAGVCGASVAQWELRNGQDRDDAIGMGWESEGMAQQQQQQRRVAAVRRPRAVADPAGRGSGSGAAAAGSKSANNDASWDWLRGRAMEGREC